MCRGIYKERERKKEKRTKRGNAKRFTWANCMRYAIVSCIFRRRETGEVGMGDRVVSSSREMSFLPPSVSFFSACTVSKEKHVVEKAKVVQYERTRDSLNSLRSLDKPPRYGALYRLKFTRRDSLKLIVRR